MNQQDFDRMNAFFETNHYDADGDAHSAAAAFDPEDDEPTVRAAGIAYFDTDGRLLLVKRHSGAEHYPDHWAFPAGHIEDGETPLQAATREMKEECGWAPAALHHLFDVHSEDGVYFTCYKAQGSHFKPLLNEEHSAYTWADRDSMPSPLHPNVLPALDPGDEEEDGEGNQPDISCGCKH